MKSQEILQKESETTLDLIPMPREVVPPPNSEIKFRIYSDIAIMVGSEDTSIRVDKAVEFFCKRLKLRTGIPILAPYYHSNSDHLSNTLVLKFDRIGEIKLGEDEYYSLSVDQHEIVIDGATDIGILRGIETLLQLLKSDSEGYYFPEIQIKDSPKYRWRGLLIDPVRHFLPVDVIKRIIRGMCMMKMNVLHIHLSDDNGFRIESKVFPDLHKIGGENIFYSQVQMKDIITYASNRGIRIIPEIDVPAHTTCWFVAYPELASKLKEYEIERNWGVFDPVMDPTKEDTYDFIDRLFTEMASLFPDEYFHIGGDENTGVQWQYNMDIVKYMKNNNIRGAEKLQHKFNLRIAKILQKNGKKMVGWDEILDDELPPSVTIQSWRGKSIIYDCAEKQIPSILSTGFYLDFIRPASYHYLNKIINDEVEDRPEYLEYILGGEAAMWGEHVSPETIDTRLWPRLCAVAERFWTDPKTKNVDDIYRRSSKLISQLEQVGCYHELNYNMLLRRLTKGRPIEPLKNLCDYLEPVKEWSRDHTGVNMLCPYSRVVDTTRPDSRKARSFQFILHKWLSTKDELAELQVKKHLAEMSRIYDDLKEYFSLNPALKEIMPAAKVLSSIGEKVLEGIDYILSKKKPDREYKLYLNILIYDAEKKHGETEIIFVDGIKRFKSQIAKL